MLLFVSNKYLRSSPVIFDSGIVESCKEFAKEHHIAMYCALLDLPLAVSVTIAHLCDIFVRYPGGNTLTQTLN